MLDKQAVLAPYTKPTVLELSPLFYFVTVYKHMNAAFAQREHAHTHYHMLVESQYDLPRANIAFWYLNANGVVELIDYTLRD